MLKKKGAISQKSKSKKKYWDCESSLPVIYPAPKGEDSLFTQSIKGEKLITSPSHPTN